MADRLLLEFQTAGHLLATPATPGLRLRPLDRLQVPSVADPPFRGLLDLERLVPIVDLGYLLAGQPTRAGLAIEAPTADGPIAFQVDAALDVRAVPAPGFRPLPRLLLAAVPRSDAWSLALVGEQVLAILSLDRVLTEAERQRVRQQCAVLAEGAAGSRR